MALSTVRLKGLADPETVDGVTGPGLPTGFPPLRADDPATGNLPSLQEPLIGRAPAIEALAAEAASAGLLTLTGPGGVGKTSLAMAAAFARRRQVP